MKLPNGSMAYVSATRGFKSGGFNPSSTVPGRGYAPEWAWSYEGGWKGTLMGGRSRFATSAFIMDYTNLQVQTPIGIGVFDIRNAAAATIRGVEVENTSRIGRGIEAGGHFTWLDATYDRYIAVNNLNVSGDVAGNRLNNAPEWAGRLWVEWAGDVGRSRRMSISAESTAQSTVFYTPFNDSIQRQSPYGLLGGRIEYGAYRSPVDCRRVRPERHGHGLHQCQLRHGAHGIWRTSWTVASVLGRFHGAPVGVRVLRVDGVNGITTEERRNGGHSRCGLLARRPEAGARVAAAGRDREHCSRHVVLTIPARHCYSTALRAAASNASPLLRSSVVNPLSPSTP